MDDGGGGTFIARIHEQRERRRVASRIRRRNMSAEEREDLLARRRRQRVPETQEKREQRRIRDRLRRERQSVERKMNGEDVYEAKMNEQKKERRNLARQMRYRNMPLEEKEELLARRRQRRRPETEQQKEQRRKRLSRQGLERCEMQSEITHSQPADEREETSAAESLDSSARRGMRLTELRRQARSTTEESVNGDTDTNSSDFFQLLQGEYFQYGEGFDGLEEEQKGEGNSAQWLPIESQLDDWYE